LNSFLSSLPKLLLFHSLIIFAVLYYCYNDGGPAKKDVLSVNQLGSLLFGFVINIVSCGSTTMQYRDRTEIIRQILEVANDAVNITRTKLMYNAFLSYNQLKDYLTLLIKRDLLSYDSITQTYKITEKGLRLLEFYNELDDMMRRHSSNKHVNNDHLHSNNKPALTFEAD
jgi:predicted transcriptional regulator